MIGICTDGGKSCSKHYRYGKINYGKVTRRKTILKCVSEDNSYSENFSYYFREYFFAEEDIKFPVNKNKLSCNSSLIQTKAFQILWPYYLCQTEFSAVAALKSRYRNKLQIENALWVSISNTKSKLDMLCTSKRLLNIRLSYNVLV